MAKIYIFPDTHHGARSTASFLKKEAISSGEKLKVVSTGDFLNMASNSSAPSGYKHQFTDSYERGDKKGMKKSEYSFINKKVVPLTKKSVSNLIDIRKYLKDGKINSVYGNNDHIIGEMAQKHSGYNLNGLLGGTKSPVNSIKEIRKEVQGNTTIYYLPHNPGMIKRYGGKDYKTIKDDLQKNKNYMSKLENICKGNKSKNILVLMHECPKPELFGYYGKQIEQRYPTPLKASNDTFFDALKRNNNGKKITLIHGHLHKGTKSYDYNGMRAINQNMKNVTEYDDKTGLYKIKKAA